MVLDTVALEEIPGLAALLGRMERLAPRIILLGESAEAAALVRKGARQVRERSPDAVAAAMGEVRQERGLAQVTFIGPPELAGPVRAAAGALQVGFAQEPFSVEAILRAFGVAPAPAAELAGGLEEALRLGRQA